MDLRSVALPTGTGVSYHADFRGIWVSDRKVAQSRNSAHWRLRPDETNGSGERAGADCGEQRAKAVVGIADVDPSTREASTEGDASGDVNRHPVLQHFLR